MSRSLAACEGAILLVDAFQGVQAQTVANAFLAMESDLTIVPVLNKIDLAIARPDDGHRRDGDGPGHRARRRCCAPAARRGIGVEDVLGAIIERVPPPPGDPDAPLKALVYNSHFDTYKGVVVYVRVMEGTLDKGQQHPADARRHRARRHRDRPVPAGHDAVRRARRRAGRLLHGPDQDAVRRPHRRHRDRRAATRPPSRCPATRSRSRWCSAGCTRSNNNDFEDLREALAKLKLNDSSFTYQPEVSEGLGFGFRCGFLGMLHREIIQQRLERDSDLDLVQTAPNVTYEILTRKGETLHRSTIRRRCRTPARSRSSASRSCSISFLLPAENIGDLMQLCTERRGVYIRTEYLSPTRAILVYEMPLAEVIYDLYDKLKSVTHGYGTMDYEFLGYRPADLVRLDILVHHNRVDALSTIVHRATPTGAAGKLVKKLREEIDRHMFEVAIQAADRQPDHRPREHRGDEEERDRQVLRRRHHAQAQAVGQASRRQEAHEAGRPGRDPQEAFLAVLESDD